MAKKYLLMAFEKGHERALDNFVSCYVHSSARDTEEQYENTLINLADKGFVSAMTTIGHHYLLRGHLDEKNFSLAKKYLHLAIKKDSMPALELMILHYKSQYKIKYEKKYINIRIKKIIMKAYMRETILDFDAQHNTMLDYDY